ncbi:MAG TPA: Flp1 family type IVb pilin [Lachnospiraceae bacterium]|nr:Flp1 family type IVb pilin [Lachnospiraceae bacterium]
MLVGLVIIFREEITGIVSDLFDNITDKTETFN